MKKFGKSKNKEKSLAKQSEDIKKTEREKVDERREEVLARGRKFKYPLQYSKHKLVFNTIIIEIKIIIHIITQIIKFLIIFIYPIPSLRHRLN